MRSKAVFVYVLRNAAHEEAILDEAKEGSFRVRAAHKETISDGSTTVLMHVLRNAAHEETILDDAK